MTSLALLLTVSGAGLSPMAAPNLFQRPIVPIVANTETSWSVVERFFDDHVVREHPLARARIRVEAWLGVKTWVLTGSASQITRLDGTGLGWPAADCTINFGTQEECLQAATLIDSATECLPEPAWER